MFVGVITSAVIKHSLIYFTSLCFSRRSTTPHQPRAPAPPPLPHLQHLLCPQMTASAPHTSWPRCGCATGGACRTARAWTKSAKHVEVNPDQTQFHFISAHVLAPHRLPLQRHLVSSFHVLHSWSWGSGRGQSGPVGGPTGHHLLCSGAGRDGQSRRRPDQLHHQKPGAENQDELQAQSGLQRL